MHARAYRETSLLVDCLTLEGGRVSMVAKGARKGKALQRRLLQPFTPLLLSYMGRGELYTLTAVEEAGALRRLAGERLACGLYLNELVVHLLPREEPAEELFAYYSHAIEALSTHHALGPLLRRFELSLLEAMGVAPSWARECSSGDAVLAERQYGLCVDGPVAASTLSTGAARIDGSTLLALARGEPQELAALPQAKRVLRYFVDLHLGGRALRSRELLRGPATPQGIV